MQSNSIRHGHARHPGVADQPEGRLASTGAALTGRREAQT